MALPPRRPLALVGSPTTVGAGPTAPAVSGNSLYVANTRQRLRDGDQHQDQHGGRQAPALTSAKYREQPNQHRVGDQYRCQRGHHRGPGRDRSPHGGRHPGRQPGLRPQPGRRHGVGHRPRDQHRHQHHPTGGAPIPTSAWRSARTAERSTPRAPSATTRRSSASARDQRRTSGPSGPALNRGRSARSRHRRGGRRSSPGRSWGP